jgi:hypothetical protein
MPVRILDVALARGEQKEVIYGTCLLVGATQCGDSGFFFPFHVFNTAVCMENRFPITRADIQHLHRKEILH